MKNKLLTLVTAVAIIAIANIGTLQAALACERAECRDVFSATLDELLDQNGIENPNIAIRTEKIYDLELNELGCLYDFTVNGTSGYALMIEMDNVFEVSEIIFGATNPYADCEGIKVYPSVATYLYNLNGKYYDAKTKIEIPEDTLAQMSEKAFYGGSVVKDTKIIVYKTRTADSWKMCVAPPKYEGIVGYNNICTAIAAGNVIGFWDRFCENLIPDYTAYRELNGRYMYKMQSTEVSECIRQLAIDMNGGNGTTVTECKSGMTTYCKRAGYSISFSKTMSWGSFNYSSSKTKMKNGEPILLFSQGFSVYDTLADPDNNKDVYSGYISTGNHAMVGFGYIDVTYTFADGSSSSSSYLQIASGQNDLPFGYFNVKAHQIDDAYSVKIS